MIVSPERKEGENLRVAFTELTQIHRAGCLKKSKFYRIEHLQAATGGSSLRIVFCRFSLKIKRDIHSSVISMGKYGSTASNFGYNHK